MDYEKVAILPKQPLRAINTGSLNSERCNCMANEQDNHEYDVTIIGAGPGGYVSALYGGLKRLKIALVEKDRRLGGTCLLRGCIPSKAMVKTAELRNGCAMPPRSAE